MKAKLTQTMYFDWHSGDLDRDKPSGRCGDDYSVIRKGTIFDVYSDPIDTHNLYSDMGIDERYKIICVDKNLDWLGFDSLKELYECDYLEVKEN